MWQGLENKKPNMISLNTLNKMSKSICKIICQKDNKEWTGTGYFMSIKFENNAIINCFLTNDHVLDHRNINSITIKLLLGDNNEKTFNIRKKRYIKYFKKPIDITMIEILNDDEFIKDVDFLSYDLNYIKNGYDYYLNKEIFILQHPYGDEMYSSIGKIISIKDYEFEHDAGTSSGSSGSAVILIENNCVIGVHKARKNSSGNKIGTFIGKLFEGIVNDPKLQERLDYLKNQANVETNKIENEDPQKITDNSESPSQKNGNKIISNNNIELEPENVYKNILTLKYRIKRNRCNAILFSKKFLKNNGNKFIMFIDNEKKEICHNLDITDMKIKNNILEVKLKKYKKYNILRICLKEQI